MISLETNFFLLIRNLHIYNYEILTSILISHYSKNLSISMRSASTQRCTFVIHATSLHQLKNYVYRVLKIYLRNQSIVINI